MELTWHLHVEAFKFVEYLYIKQGEVIEFIL